MGPTTPGQAQFGIVQGGVFEGLRTASVAATLDVGFEGYAIGGLSVGEPVEQMYEIVGKSPPCCRPRSPGISWGRGMPDDLVIRVALGIDLFDCVLPTRNARNGQVMTSRGPINIRNASHAEADGPIEEGCGCYTCRHFSRAYLRHLATVGEMTSATLNTLHNLHFYLDTMRRIRDAIKFGSFEKFKESFLYLLPPAPDSMTASSLPELAFLMAMGTPPEGAPSLLVQFVPFALILGIFYFVILMPMKRRQKKVAEFQAALKVGDRVVTTSGIYGVDCQSQ